MILMKHSVVTARLPCPSTLNPLDPIDEFTRHFDPLHLWKPFQTQRGSKTPPVCPKGSPFRTALKRGTRGGLEGGVSVPPFMRGVEGGRRPLRSRPPRNIRANCAPVGVFPDSPSPTRAKGGGVRHATPMVNPFVYVGLVGVLK